MTKNIFEDFLVVTKQEKHIFLEEFSIKVGLFSFECPNREIQFTVMWLTFWHGRNKQDDSGRETWIFKTTRTNMPKNYSYPLGLNMILNETSLLRRLQAQTLSDATPPRGQIHPFSKMAITFEPVMVF